MEFDGSEVSLGVLAERGEQVETLRLKEVEAGAFANLASRIANAASEAGYVEPGFVPHFVDGSLEVPETEREKGLETLTLRATTEIAFQEGHYQLTAVPEITLQLSFNGDPGIDVALLQRNLLTSDDSGLRDENGDVFEDEDSVAWVVRLIDEAFPMPPQE